MTDHRPFRRRGPALMLRDAALLLHLTARFLLAGAPENWPGVPVNLKALARVMGYHAPGGREVEAVKAALHRVASVTYEGRVHLREGWLFLQFAVARVEYGRLSVTPEYAEVVRGGAYQLLDPRLFTHLMTHDEVAARLWMFLESHSPRHWSYGVFRAHGQGSTPTIAALANLHWKQEANVVRRIRTAAKAISEIDPRYEFALAKPGEWELHVWRHEDPLTPTPVERNLSKGAPPVALVGVAGARRGPTRCRSGATRVSDVFVPSVGNLSAVQTVHPLEAIANRTTAWARTVEAHEDSAPSIRRIAHEFLQRREAR